MKECGNMMLEHFVTLFGSDQDTQKKEEYLDQVWDILQESYRSIGGLANISDADELLSSEYI